MVRRLASVFLLILAVLSQLLGADGAMAPLHRHTASPVQRQERNRVPSRLDLYGKGKWDLAKVFRDEPKGAYLNLLKPLVYAAYMPYPTTAGERYNKGPWERSWDGVYHANETDAGDLTGDGHWQRLYDVEKDPKNGGPHTRVIVDREAQRAIVAFRGTCMDPTLQSCRNDLCVTTTARSGIALDVCSPFLVSLKSYVQQAFDNVERVVNLLGPEYGVMVTGHSLGGLLAETVDALGQLNIQTVGLEPTPFGKVMKYQLGLSAEQIASLDAKRRYAIYDNTDLESTMYAPLDVLRPSTTVCVYDQFPLPKECTDCMKTHPNRTAEKALDRCLEWPPDSKLVYSRCKDAVHFLDRYIEVFIPSKNADGNVVLPTCTVIGVANPFPAPSAPTISLR